MILKRYKHGDWPHMIRSSDCPAPMVDFAAELSAIVIAHAHARARAHAPCSMDGIFINWANEQHDGRPWHSPL